MDDFTYDSTWVFATLHGPKAYFEYLEGKLATQKKSNYKCNFCLVEDVCSGRPILLLLPRTPEGDYGCFVVDCNEKGKATSLNIMPSIFYKWKPIDEDEYAAFVASEK